MGEIAESLADARSANGAPSPPSAVAGRAPANSRHTRRPPTIQTWLYHRSYHLTARLAGETRRAFASEASHGHVFLFVPVCLGAGAVTWFSFEANPSTVALAVVLSLLAISAFAARHGIPLLRHGLMAVSLFVCGMLLADLETWRRQTVILDTPVTTVVSGVIERREAGARGEWRYIMRVTGTAEPRLKRPPERVSLLARPRDEPPGLGEAITGRARLSPPSGPALPGLNDFAFSSYFDGIGAVGYFLGSPRRLVGEVTPGAAGWLATADRALFSLRDRITSRIRAVIPGDAGGFAASIITGDRRSMSKEMTEALRLSGLAHITAISGLNMALAAGIFFVGLRMVLSLFPALVQSFPIKKIAASGALVAAFLYLLISGYQVSAVRAFLMTAIMLIAVLFDRPAISLRNLALAAITIIALTPSEVMGPSFQMSFAATAALIAGYGAWRSKPAVPPLRLPIPGSETVRVVWRFFAGTFMTSLIGGMSTAIFAIAHFNRLAPYSLQANLAAMPVISLLVMPAGLVAMLLMPFGLDGPFLRAMGIGLEIVMVIAKAIAGWGEGFVFPRLEPWFLPIAASGLLFMTLLHTWLRHTGILVLAAAVILSAVLPPERSADVLVSEDGQLVGLPAPGTGTMATNKKKAPSFIFSQWQRATGLKEPIAPLEAETGTERLATKTDIGVRLSNDQIEEARKAMRQQIGMGEVGRFSCTKKAWCLARLANGWKVAAVENPTYVGAACDIADIVVAARRMPFSACKSGARLITAETLRSTGSLELHLGDRATREIRQQEAFTNVERPWQVHRLYDWRSDTFQGLSAAGSASTISDNGG
ncbi:MAG: ComEC/Rec2 family competence protein [Rhizobium sp.]